MVGELIRLKLTLLRRSMSGQWAVQLFLGGVIGLLAAAGTVYLATLDFGVPEVRGDLLAMAMLVWLAGWALGPILFGAGQNDLRADQLVLFPIGARTLTLGLLAAAGLGVGPAVTLVALTGLLVYAAPFGLLATLAGLIALPLTLALFVLLSKVITAVRGQVVRSQPGAALSGLFTAALLAAANSVWALAPALGVALATGFPDTLSATMRALPSGWALTSIDAVGRRDWLLAIGALGGLLVLDLLLAGVWATVLRRQLTAGRGNGRRPRAVRLAGVDDGVTGKELRTWLRDVTRTHFVFFAVFYGLLQAVIPLVNGATIFLPWTGLMVVVWTAAVTANLYGTDGTALWLTLVTPGGERADVRGRQYAWLLVVAPIAIVLTVVFAAVAGLGWAWPWAIALTAAALGAGSGAVVLVAVHAMVPLTDPRNRGSGAWENRIDVVQVIGVLAVVVPSLAPTFGVLWLSGTLDVPALAWVAVVLGVASGVAYAWGFGLLAARRLAAQGPELLSRMRSGPAPVAVGRPPALAGGTGQAPPWAVAVVLSCFVACWVPLVAQGLVPMILKLAGSGITSWFLALHMPQAYQWWVIGGMMLLGLVLIGIGLAVARNFDIRPGAGFGGVPARSSAMDSPEPERRDIADEVRKAISGRRTD
ncbi:hypothetical protein [Actinoplanes sp. DH11]|uniref:hypothetical protein n=1 Tax=Actinoplanes sp. DH11 TaxID=2857011 RepID=UPI001E5904BD|nr:hypothetical protein [Actinoplanes sp. DH11]